MAPTIQAKLLRALQEGEIRKVGGERNIRVNLAWWRRPTAT
jgi:transcriptional regulator with GAF, ATPase, and Fis domain